MRTVEIIRSYKDSQLGRRVHTGAILEVTKERGEVLIHAGKAKWSDKQVSKSEEKRTDTLRRNGKAEKVIPQFQSDDMETTIPSEPAEELEQPTTPQVETEDEAEVEETPEAVEVTNEPEAPYEPVEGEPEPIIAQGENVHELSEDEIPAAKHESKPKLGRGSKYNPGKKSTKTKSQSKSKKKWPT